MPSLTPPLDPTRLRADLRTQGYIILPSCISQSLISRLLFASRKLTAAARAGHWPHIRTCPKQFPPWPDQPGEEGIWGVQHLLHPGLHQAQEGEDGGEGDGGEEGKKGKEGVLSKKEAATFAELYFGDAMTAAVRAILEVPLPSGADEETNDSVPDGQERQTEEEEPLTLKLLNLLISPPSDFSLRWHRDNVTFDQSIEDEAAALGLIQQSFSEDSHTGYSGQGEAGGAGGAYAHVNGTSAPADGTGGHAHGGGHSNPFATTEHTFYTPHPALRQKGYTQYNIPLLPDCSLHLIPGSHLRPRTVSEAELLRWDPYSDEIEGWIKVELKEGDVVFYDNNLIHRGVYAGGQERYTLHGSVSRADCNTDRARNVLQHGVGSWVDGCDFSSLLARLPGTGVEGRGRAEAETLRKRAEGMKRNLIRLGGGRDGDDVGYAHVD